MVTVVVDRSIVGGQLEHLFIETLMFISRILICTVIVGHIAILLFKCFIPCHELIFNLLFFTSTNVVDCYVVQYLANAGNPKLETKN